MIAITIGGALFPSLQHLVSKFLSSPNESEVAGALIYLIASISMIIPSICVSSLGSLCFQQILISFVLVETCVGLFMPIAGTLRTKYVPDALHGAILNIFRLPLNVIVVIGTYATDILPASQVFMFVSGCFFTAALIQATMLKSSARTKID